jgi:hypothetical protein
MAIVFKRKPLSVPTSSEPGPLMAAVLTERRVSNLVWRFYMDQGHKWKWQHLSMHGEVISESARGYKNYENCLANAKENGHLFEPSQAKTRSVETAPFYPN